MKERGRDDRNIVEGDGQGVVGGSVLECWINFKMLKVC